MWQKMRVAELALPSIKHLWQGEWRLPRAAKWGKCARCWVNAPCCPSGPVQLTRSCEKRKLQCRLEAAQARCSEKAGACQTNTPTRCSTHAVYWVISTSSSSSSPSSEMALSCSDAIILDLRWASRAWDCAATLPSFSVKMGPNFMHEIRM